MSDAVVGIAEWSRVGRKPHKPPWHTTLTEEQWQVIREGHAAGLGQSLIARYFVDVLGVEDATGNKIAAAKRVLGLEPIYNG